MPNNENKENNGETPKKDPENQEENKDSQLEETLSELQKTVEEQQKTIDSLHAQKKHFKEKLEKKDTQPSKDNDVPSNKLNEIENTVSTLALSEKKRKFGYQNNLSPKEVDYIFKYAGDKDPSEVLEDPFVQGGLSKIRAKDKVESATPSAKNRVPVFNTKNFREMDIDEKRSTYEKQVQKILKGKS